MYTNKTWREKLNDDNPNHGKIVKILIPKPLDVDALVRQVPVGKLVTTKQLLDKLAKDAGADKTCSKVTGMFLRIVAEVAEENWQEGRNIDEITPYWRVVKTDGRLHPRFPGGTNGQARRLIDEGHEIIEGQGKKPPMVKGFESNLYQY